MPPLVSTFVGTILLTITTVSGTLVKRSDDRPALEALVQQQGLTIQKQQVQMTAMQQSLIALTGKVDSMETELQQSHQKQAAFHVKFAGSYNTPLNVGTHAVLKFNSAITNVGSAYNTETGIFTAPFAGSYLFFLDATHIPQHSVSSQLAIMMTGHKALASTYGKPTSTQPDIGDYTSDTTQAAVHLMTGEQVWVEHAYGGTLFRQSAFTTFTGALVQAD